MGKQMALLKRARSLLRDFAISSRGNVAMMFGIALVPLMIAAGAGLDYARSALVRAQMSDALDAAALAVGSTTGLDRDKAEALAKKYFEANYQGSGAPQVTIASGGYDSQGSVVVTANYTMPTMLLKIVGKNDVQITTSSKVVWGQTKLWVSLVLDNSGSMCQPLSQPCNDTTDATTKIYQLKAATKKMLTKLQAVSATAGDVRVGIVPFNRSIDVGTSNVGATWIDWTDWEAPPANAGTISGNVGPGSSCPFSNGSYGWRCTQGSSNGSSSTNTIPSSGLICPSIDNGDFNTNHRDRYYNGCWNSVPTQTKTVTKTDTTPITTQRQTCQQVGSGTINCTNQNGYPQSGSTSSNTTTTTTAGYTGDSTNTSTTNSAITSSDGTKTCNTKKGVKTCTWNRTFTQTKTDVTATKTGVGPYSHTWQVNAHSTWGGCIMDRDKASDYDISNTAPSTTATGFPAANPSSPVSSTNCLYGDITALNYDWTDLAAKVDAMQARGSTNQAIGVAHGWQMLTQGDPYATPAVPANTTRYIILFSDGLNTQNRWWGDGSTEGTTEDGYIDDRMELTCSAAKTSGVVIYTLYVHVNGGGNSQPLQDCASDSSKYFDLTTVAQIDTAFTEITKQITNVRVAQ